ncbi:UNVERIFIED_CONTAM: hypothetical protein FKN15_066514 [Acipenser sinensis]
MNFPLFLPLLVFMVPYQGDAAVVRSFAEKPGCDDFFFNKKEPTGLNPASSAIICQTYASITFYATLYDRANRIPRYSAYVVDRNAQSTGRESYWKIEPQLADNNLGENMEDESDFKIQRKDKIQALVQSQAVDADYKEKSNIYDRGHLNPNQHHNTEESRAATFTLTNIVPQTKKVNHGQCMKTCYKRKHAAHCML